MDGDAFSIAQTIGVLLGRVSRSRDRLRRGTAVVLLFVPGVCSHAQKLAEVHRPHPSVGAGKTGGWMSATTAAQMHSSGVEQSPHVLMDGIVIGSGRLGIGNSSGAGPWHGQSGSGSGHIGHSIGIFFCVIVDGAGTTEGGDARRVIVKPAPFSALKLSTSIWRFRTNSSNPFFSSSQPSRRVTTASSAFIRSLSAFSARATSCSRTFEWISSASYARNRSSRVWT